ncbi:hypothetical protein HALLA_15995 [Halostagnicola larsenii XH-48]|uniref:Uncharacterized protein n=1 Tax=Halostagnicola larsenii XH-48 TaxID=797299 RepID=W0JQS1_9EURY|nr:hypothetical protein HALLA_15995 [Halostagnicola larsenii XH-48]
MNEVRSERIRPFELRTTVSTVAIRTVNCESQLPRRVSPTIPSTDD